MTTKGIGSVLLLAVLLGTLPAAPPLPLDLVPEQACIAIAVRNLTELKEKSDRLLKDNTGLPRFSQAFDELIKEMKLGWKVDEKASMAGICATAKLGGFGEQAEPGNNFQIGTAIPFVDLKEVAREWKVDPADLAKGEVVNVPGRVFADRFFAQTKMAAGEKHAFMSGSKSAVEAWRKADSLRKGLPAERQKKLDLADGLVYLGPPLFLFSHRHFDPDWAPEHLSERERAAHKRLNKVYLEARSVLGAYRLDEGLGLDLNVGFEPKGKESQALIQSFAGPGRKSSLAGLPEGEVVGALSLVGVEAKDLDVVRILSNQVYFGWYGANRFILESDAPLLRRVVGDLYAKNKMLRGALYNTKGPGSLAVVAVLEPKNLESFVKDLQKMAQLADVKGFEPMGNAAQAEIAKWIADLGADDYEVRESATTKLALVGEPALAGLKKAEKSDDAEVRRRAGELVGQIERVAALRKKELNDGLLKQAFHPQFSFKEKAETRGGVVVHELGVAFVGEEAPYAALMKHLFGPDWNRVRIAVVGDKLVALLGSDLALLDAAIQNVRDNKPGLEASAGLAGFRKQTGTDRVGEVHLALRTIQAMTTAKENLPRDFKPSPTLSSAAVRVGQADITVDLWAPADAILDAIGWFRF